MEVQRAAPAPDPLHRTARCIRICPLPPPHSSAADSVPHLCAVLLYRCMHLCTASRAGGAQPRVRVVLQPGGGGAPGHPRHRRRGGQAPARRWRALLRLLPVRCGGKVIGAVVDKSARILFGTVDRSQLAWAWGGAGRRGGVAALPWAFPAPPLARLPHSSPPPSPRRCPPCCLRPIGLPASDCSNWRQVRSSIVHFQLRNLLWATSGVWGGAAGEGGGGGGVELWNVLCHPVAAACPLHPGCSLAAADLA